MLGPFGPQRSGIRGRGAPLAQLAAKAAQRYGVDIKRGRDLLVGERQDLGQLRDHDALSASVVTRVAGDQMTVEEDRALIVGVEGLQARRQGAEMDQVRISDDLEQGFRANVNTNFGGS